MSFNISLYPLKRSATEKTAIYVSISDGQKRLRFASGISVPIKALIKIKRTDENKSFKGRKLLNQTHENYFLYNDALKNVEKSITEIYFRLGIQTSLEAVRDLYYKEHTKRHSDNRLLEAVLSEFMAANPDWTEGTRQVYKSLQKHLVEFRPEQEISTFNELVVDEFIKYLEGQGMMNSTSNKYLKSIKAFMRWAISHDYIRIKANLSTIKPKDKGKAWKVALTYFELEQLISAELEERLDKVRIVFAVQCMSGQRFSDANKVITLNSISTTLIQQKTQDSVTIPMHPKLKKYLEAAFKKYPQGIAEISNQKMNIYLKELFKKIGLDREVSRVVSKGKSKVIEKAKIYEVIGTHDGRRTFCTMSYFQKIAPAIIMQVSGHKKMATFMEYIVIEDKETQEAYSKWE